MAWKSCLLGFRQPACTDNPSAQYQSDRVAAFDMAMLHGA